MKTNSIYEALNNVDDKFVSEAAKVRGKRPVALMITTASLAAALALAIGIRNFGGAIGNYISPADSAKQNGASYQAADFVKFNPPSYTIPAEFSLDVDEEFKEFNHLDMLPTELFAKLGYTPLMNESFTDEIDFTQVRIDSGEGAAEYGKPNLRVEPDSLDFDYVLRDNVIGENVHFFVTIQNDKEAYINAVNSILNLAERKKITLNDGSNCVILDEGFAMFSYNSTIYKMSIEKISPKSGELEQVLRDLGVLDDDT